MGDLRDFKKLKSKESNNILQSMKAVCYLFCFSIALVPLFIVSMVFYWTLSINDKERFANLIYSVNDGLTNILKDLENGKK